MIKINEVIIGDKIINEIIDEEGTKWYPMKAFLQKVLCKYDHVSAFRDSTISKYMKVFEFCSYNSHVVMKTWCINEKGIKFLLKNMRVNKTKKDRLYKAKVKGFFEACDYFHVKTPNNIAPIFVNNITNFDDYEFWTVLCIENDTTINQFTKWKKCPECLYYYPYNKTFFGDNIKKDSICLQCKGENFKCKNVIIQCFYDNGGYDFLYDVYNSEEDNPFIDKFKNAVINGAIQK